MAKAKAHAAVLLRPSVINPDLWFPDRPPKTEWERVRKVVLERDNYTCVGCGHRAQKYMNVHHLKETGGTSLRNLVTVCVACHAVLHIGRNLELGTIEIWESPISQVEIVQRTREGVKRGQSLAKIKKGLKLKRGEHPPKSVQFANDLIDAMGKKPRGYLPEPLCAVFVSFRQWQLE